MLKHYVCAAASAVALAAGLLWSDAPARAQSAPPACGIDLRVLVISADGSEADLPAIRTALDYIGTPYDVYVATDHPEGLDAGRLANGCRALYQGVILTTAALAYAAPDGSFVSAFTPADFETLAAFEDAFDLRRVNWYAYPTPEIGFNYPAIATGDPLDAHLTAAGQQVFHYLNAGPSGLPVPIQFSWTYLTTPIDESSTPLLVDDSGHTLAATRAYPDGRETLTLTFDSNQHMRHAQLLGYGLVNWVTKGLFVGDRHAYISPQIDDVFIDI